MDLFNKKKRQMEKARKISEYVEKRVICSNHTTVCLSIDGKVKCTKMLHDDLGSFDMGYAYTKFWKDIQKLFLIDGEYASFGSCLIGIDASHHVFMTERKDRQIGEALKSLDGIQQVYSFPLSQYVFVLKKEGTILSIPVRSSHLLEKVTGRKENLQGVENVKDIEEILYECQYQQLILRKRNGQCEVTKGNFHEKWKNIKTIVPVWQHYVGLSMDGHVEISSSSSNCYKEELNQLKKMKDIEQIVTLNEDVIVLHKTGEVTYLTKENQSLKKKFEGYKDILKIYKRKNGYYYALCLDGTVQSILVKESPYTIHFQIESWKEIIGLSFERDWVVGIKKDGSLVATGCDDYGQCQLEGMRLYKDFEDLRKKGF